MENSETVFGFTFSGVPTEKLKDLPERVHEVLGGLASGQEEVDMQRMTAIIKKSILQILNNVSGRVRVHTGFSVRRGGWGCLPNGFIGKARFFKNSLSRDLFCLFFTIPEISYFDH